MQSKELKKSLRECPFCGGEANLRKSAFFTCKAFVKCKKCGARTLEYSSASMEDAEMNAINSWNARKSMKHIVEELERQKMRFVGDLHNIVHLRQYEAFVDAINIVKGGVDNAG